MFENANVIMPRGKAVILKYLGPTFHSGGVRKAYPFCYVRGESVGATRVVIQGYEDVMKELKGMEAKSKKVINRTIGDFKSRGPGWISQEVTNEYNIKKKEINSTLTAKKSAGTIKVSGTSLDNIQLIYRGRLLTPTHFSMKPTARPAKGKSYTVSAVVKKSSGRKALSSKAFLAHSGAAGTKQIPFQRTTDKRLPIQAIKTISVPQMITNETVMTRINEHISTELKKRLEHHVATILKK